MGLRSRLRLDASLLWSLPTSVAAGTIVAWPIPPAPGLWPFLKLAVAGIVAGGIYGSRVPGTKPNQTPTIRGGIGGMAVGVPAFLLPLAVWVGSLNVVEYFGPLVVLLVLIGPVLMAVGFIPGAVGGRVGHRLRRQFEPRGDG